MRKVLLYPAGSSLSCQYAAKVLHAHAIALIDHPSPEITHLLLDTPSFTDECNLPGGGSAELLLSMLPSSITVIGGNLKIPLLREYNTLDLLTDEEYLCKNASITAHCAIKTALPHLSRVLSGCKCMIIGWGRIGKHLGSILVKMGCDVTLVIRNPKEIALARSFGYRVCASHKPELLPRNIDLVFNTVPQKIIPADAFDHIKGCVKIDLASSPGFDVDNVIIARGLPGKLAPESSGNLIAESILNHLKEG